jgi:hypothetical protein
MLMRFSKSETVTEFLIPSCGGVKAYEDPQDELFPRAVVVAGQKRYNFIHEVERPRPRILCHCETGWNIFVRYPLSKKVMDSTSGIVFFAMQALLNDTKC